MTLYIAPVVEGHTEQRCVERLLQRIWSDLLGRTEPLRVLPPHRHGRNLLISSANSTLPQVVQKAYQDLISKSRYDPDAQSLLLILLDCETEDPKTLEPQLLSVAVSALPPGSLVSCVLATRMIENWFVAGCSTLAGLQGLPTPLLPPSDPEGRSGTKWLDDQIKLYSRGKNKYKKTTDAAVFALKMNLQECRASSPSFDKLCRELERLIPPLVPPPSPPPLPPDPAPTP